MVRHWCVDREIGAGEEAGEAVGEEEQVGEEVTEGEEVEDGRQVRTRSHLMRTCRSYLPVEGDDEESEDEMGENEEKRGGMEKGM